MRKVDKKVSEQGRCLRCGQLLIWEVACPHLAGKSRRVGVERMVAE